MTNTETYVFLGPTLATEEAKAILPNAIFLPPAKKGDIIKAVQLGAKRILIIDGYFEVCASIWHKEILYALNEKIIVAGTSSMGALRAAELNAYGMIGIGKIYQLYKNNFIRDDDEVAIVHDKKTYLSKSIALINVRFTLQKSVTENIITEQESLTILETFKKDFYKERSWDKALRQLNFQNKAQFLIWLENPVNYVDQKKLDGIEGLKKINSLSSEIVPTINNTLYLRKILRDQFSRPLSYENKSPSVDTISFAELLAKTLPYDINPDAKVNYKIVKFLMIVIGEYQLLTKKSNNCDDIQLILDMLKQEDICKYRFYIHEAKILSEIVDQLSKANIRPSKKYCEIILAKIVKQKGVSNKEQLIDWQHKNSLNDSLQEFLEFYFYLDQLVEAYNYSLLNKIPKSSISLFNNALSILKD